MTTTRTTGGMGRKVDMGCFLCQSLTMRLLKIPLLDLMPRRDRIVIAAAAFLYMAGQLCEILLGWSVIATESAALLMVTVGGVYVLALLAYRQN